MGYKWLPLTEDFDRSLPILKIRWDVSVPTWSGSTDICGYSSEKPNCYADGLTWDTTPNTEAGGYIRQNRWNATLNGRYAPNTFCNRYYNFTDEKWTATTHTTLVSGTTYEFVCPVPLYYAGLQSAYTASLAEKIQYYVEGSFFEITPNSKTVSAKGGSFTVDIHCNTTWTASTNDNWITLSDSTGGTTTISISIPYNQFDTRVGTVSFTDGEEVLTLTVTQEANDLIPTNKMFRNGNRIN